MTKIFITSILLAYFSCASACTLPYPDNDEEKPSPPNHIAKIVAVRRPYIYFEEIKTNKKLLLRAPPGLNANTAFGGDFEIVDIKPGVYAKIWTRNCEKYRKKMFIAHFEIFSNSTEDKPGDEFFDVSEKYYRPD